VRAFQTYRGIDTDVIHDADSLSVSEEIVR